MSGNRVAGAFRRLPQWAPWLVSIPALGVALALAVGTHAGGTRVPAPSEAQLGYGTRTASVASVAPHRSSVPTAQQRSPATVSPAAVPTPRPTPDPTPLSVVIVTPTHRVVVSPEHSRDGGSDDGSDGGSGSDDGPGNDG
jgi:hypothetical protein